MKKTIIISFAVLALASCGGHKSAIEHEIDDYATVTVPVPDLSGISDNGKEVLNLYRFAAQEADNIYWKQYFGDKALIDAIEAPDVKKFALINYGPWNRLDGKTFVEGYSERAAGVNFYPADMTSEEFDSCNLEDKESPYTLIKRDSTGLKAVWFHDEYSGEINKISAFLTAAADITIKPSVRNYLLKKIEGLKTDNYYDSDIAWLEMEDSKMDLVIGPNETNDDQFKGIKKSYGALVLLKDLVRTDHLGRYAALIPELQKELPCPEQFKAFAPGNFSDVFVCDALYYAGSYNAGVKEIAINLPYDERVQEERGTRTILLGNVIDAKFNSIISPVGELFLSEDFPNIDRNAGKKEYNFSNWYNGFTRHYVTFCAGPLVYATNHQDSFEQPNSLLLSREEIAAARLNDRGELLAGGHALRPIALMPPFDEGPQWRTIWFQIKQ